VSQKFKASRIPSLHPLPFHSCEITISQYDLPFLQHSYFKYLQPLYTSNVFPLLLLRMSRCCPTRKPQIPSLQAYIDQPDEPRATLASNLTYNPSHTVPTLIPTTSSAPSSKDFHITQSFTALKYLNELHPNPPLLPSGLEMRAIVRELANIIACDVQPVTNLLRKRKLQCA
jgi:hypothetical protein